MNFEKLMKLKLLKKIAMLLMVVLIILLGWFELKFWPTLLHRFKNPTQEGKVYSNWRLGNSIKDEVDRIWAPHSWTLMQCDTLLHNGGSKAEILEQLKQLPAVDDIYFVDFAADTIFLLNRTVHPDSLLSALKIQKANKGGRSGFARRLVSGLTKFENFQEQVVLTRYLGTYYPRLATQAIGLVLNQDWFFTQIPVRLDSLARDNLNLALFSPIAPDTIQPDEDPYYAPGGTWKNTMGLMHGKDTLWWYGDRTQVINRATPMGTSYDDDFDLMYLTKNEFGKYDENVKAEARILQIIFPVLELTAVLMILVLLASIYLTSRQVKNHKIALSHLAHAIKTPVARLKLSSEMLREGHVSSPAEEQELIGYIGLECERLELAVQNAAYNLEGGSLTVDKSKFELSQLLAEIIESWQPTFKRSGINLVALLLEQKLFILADRAKLRIMIDNLLDNALRHTYVNKQALQDDTAMVKMSVSILDQNLSITIDDSGAGISAKDRHRIFKPFERSKDDALTGVSGLGLGLVVVKEIAKAHQGSVAVTDSDQGGARFNVELPIGEN